MSNISINADFFIIYVLVMAVCIIAITALDIKRIRMIRKNTEAVNKNTMLYDKILEASVHEQETRELYAEIVKSYKISLDKNTETHERLIQLLSHEQQAGGQAAGDGATEPGPHVREEIQVMPFMMTDGRKKQI